MFVGETKRELVHGLDEERKYCLIANFRNVGTSQNGKCSKTSGIEEV